MWPASFRASPGVRIWKAGEFGIGVPTEVQPPRGWLGQPINSFPLCTFHLTRPAGFCYILPLSSVAEPALFPCPIWRASLVPTQWGKVVARYLSLLTTVAWGGQLLGGGGRVESRTLQIFQASCFIWEMSRSQGLQIHRLTAVFYFMLEMERVGTTCLPSLIDRNNRKIPPALQ